MKNIQQEQSKNQAQTEKFRSATKAIEASDDEAAFDAALKKLAVGLVLIDIVNMCPVARAEMATAYGWQM
jgi:hypothetical protein